MRLSASQINRALEPAKLRLDANEALVFSRQLEFVQAEIVRTEYPEFMLRKLVPQSEAVDSGAETFTWRLWNRVGQAKMIANYATDLPNVANYASENTTPIKGIGASYSYSIQEIRRAAKANVALNAELGITARETIEQEIEKTGALGDSALNLPGLLNNANVTTMTSGYVGNWDAAGTTGIQILRDLRLFENRLVKSSKNLHRPTTIVVGSTSYEMMASKEVDTTNHETALSAFLRTSPNVREVIYWPYMDLADAQGDGERILVYEKNPRNLKLVVPVDYEEFPPQADNLSFKIPCHARLGGVVVQRPLALMYVDGILDGA